MIFDLENEDEEEDDDIWWARTLDFRHTITLEGRSYAFYSVPNVIQSFWDDVNNSIQGSILPFLTFSNLLTLEMQLKHDSFPLQNIPGLDCAAPTAP
jgi:hypothetical protein